MKDHICRCPECGATFQIQTFLQVPNNACAAPAYNPITIYSNAAAVPLTGIPVPNVAAGCNPNTFFTLKVGG